MVIVLRRHTDSGAPCSLSPRVCGRDHHRPKHRRSGPHNVNETGYEGRHKVTSADDQPVARSLHLLRGEP